MCGRFLLDCGADDIEALACSIDSKAPPPPKLTKRYNVAPTQEHITLSSAAEGDARTKAGIHLSWHTRTFGYLQPERPLLLNARAETAYKLPTFRRAWQHSRCVALATGFYEWQPTGAKKGAKTPFLIREQSAQPFGLAALALGDGAFVVVTTAANETMMPIHTRMPVLLRGEHLTSWLNPATKASSLDELCNPLLQPKLRLVEISRYVNNPRHDDAKCIAPAEQLSFGF